LALRSNPGLKLANAFGVFELNNRSRMIYTRRRILLVAKSMARILSIYIDPDTCTCSQACVLECPQVLDGDTEDGVPRIREGAETFYETHLE
jgi:NAD-dependent dihydropyrimidine dehydrogenase PreA subunit